MSVEVLMFALSIITAIGAFIAWIISQLADKHNRNIELERRISGLEQNLRISETKNSGSSDDISNLKRVIQSFEERTRNNEINIAVLKNEKKRDS
ncbi:hypothetical protein QEF67_000015 [Klebsiella aerogenes]|uniref:hypothetical protein n=1 Tax=Klebsiella aerogenes TaxID=548 RepID=UPI0007352405|nr:hypothetical protein [Klebsiella aerogenes]EKT3979537.1 hypothetical protein [Klebsiella aerogenes]KTH33878.1 hypothetical protein ASV26_08635 [Klebsiella aerogenes]MCY4762674.1 hypothetical protein [Klebsiella aerogenes]MDT4308387.1 hypothetical protein [Klebsiella aerogenes]PLC39115.1 hypothetical protein C0Q87_02700 [Klebsiella aerogenes]